MFEVELNYPFCRLMKDTCQMFYPETPESFDSCFQRMIDKVSFENYILHAHTINN